MHDNLKCGSGRRPEGTAAERAGAEPSSLGLRGSGVALHSALGAGTSATQRRAPAHVMPCHVMRALPFREKRARAARAEGHNTDNMVVEGDCDSSAYGHE